MPLNPARRSLERRNRLTATAGTRVAGSSPSPRRRASVLSRVLEYMRRPGPVTEEEMYERTYGRQHPGGRR